MKKLIAFLFLASFTFSCSFFKCLEGDGNILKSKKDVSGFKEINVFGSGKMHLSQGAMFLVEIETDSNLTDKVSFVKSGEDLIINPSNICPSELNYFVTMPEIEEIEIEGDTDINAPASIKTEEMEIEINGEGNLNLTELKAKNVNIEINGAGSVTILGECNELTINMKGSGSLNALNFEAKEADIELSGSGNASLNVSEKMNIFIEGSGSISYKGKPDLKQKIRGSGEVTNIK